MCFRHASLLAFPVAALLVIASGALGPVAAQASSGEGTASAASERRPAASPGPFFGPLTSEEAAPLQRIAFTHITEGADLVGAGVLEGEFWMGYANIFEQDSASTHVLFMDLERLSTATGVRWGASDRIEVGGRLSFETTGGGFLDGFVTGWHEALGLGNGNREKYPNGAYEQQLRDGLGRVRVDMPPRTMALEDVRIFAKWRAWARGDGRGLLSLSGQVRIPTQDDFAGPRRTDVALVALGRRSWTRWHVHGAVGGATVRAADAYDGLLRRASFFTDLAVERALAPWVSGVAQLSVASPRLQGFEDPELDGWPVNLVFGLTGRVGDGWLVDVSFQEDVPANTPAVDFTLGIGVRRRW
jgi:hypothetical protein